MTESENIAKLNSQLAALKKENEELKQAQIRSTIQEDILSTTTDFMSFIDEDFVYREVNESYLISHKLTREEIVGKKVSDIWGNQIFVASIKDHLLHAFAGQKVKYTEWFKFKGIGKRFIEVTYFPHSDKNKNLKGVVVRGRDLTRQKQTERALRESEQRFRALDDNRLLGFAVVCNMPPKFVYVNKTMAKLTGFRVKDLKEFSFAQIMKLIYAEDRNLFVKLYPKLLSGEVQSHSQVFRGVTNKGGIIWAEAFVNRIEYKGNPALLIAFKDISARVIAQERVSKYIKQLKMSKEREVNKANELKNLYKEISEREIQLKKENADKDKFFSIISHDLRSPFTALLGYAQLLEEDFEQFGTEELKTAIEAMSKISKNIYTLIEGLLEWSRTRTGRIDFNPEYFDFYEAAKTVKIITNDIALKKNINIEIDVQEGTTAYADIKMVDTILRNMVTNAIKFTNNGGSVNISAQVIDDNLKVAVSDTGIGMSGETLNKLFKIDVHHTTVGTNNEIGTGLGLIIAKEFTEKNHGKIWVDSKKDNGTTFYFTLPLQKALSSN